MALRLITRALRRSYGTNVEGKSRIGRITLGMLGDEASPVLSVKAAEMRHSVEFFVRLVATHAAYLDDHGQHGTRLANAGQHLLHIYRCMNDEPRMMSRKGQARFLTETKSFLKEWGLAEGHRRPKHHMMLHMAEDVPISGNPRFYNVYSDEAMNMDMVTLARSAHICDFEARCLSRTLLADDIYDDP